MFDSIANAIISPVLKIIDKVIPDTAAREAAKQEIIKMQMSGELEEMKTSISAILAEAQSTDPWTSRARPSFMWVFYLLLISLIILAPFVGVFAPSGMALFYDNVGRGFKAIPDAMWSTFTIGYLGYTGARTYEKYKKSA